MAFQVTYAGGIFFIVCLLLIEELTAVPTVPPPIPESPTDKIKRDNFFNYLASGFDLTTATLDDMNDTEGLKIKKRIWMTNRKTQSKMTDAYTNHIIGYPKSVTCINVPNDTNLDISVNIYNEMDDLEKLLTPATDKVEKEKFLLPHKLEQFENRFRETTLPKKRVVNGLAVATIREFQCHSSEWNALMVDKFKNRVKEILGETKPKELTDLYTKFTADYGTHFVDQVSFGGILMLDISVPMKSSALETPEKTRSLEKQIETHLRHLLKQSSQDTTEAKKAYELNSYKKIFFGGLGTQQNETQFYTGVRWNRTISRVRLQPISSLITKVNFPSTPDAVLNVQKRLQKIEKSHAFVYQLNRLKAACDVALKSPFNLTAMAYQNCQNTNPYLDYFQKTTSTEPYPLDTKDKKFEKYISKIAKWPLEYQIGLRGSLGDS